MPGFNSIDGLASGLNTTQIIDAILTFDRRNAVLFEIQVEEKTNEISTLKALQAKFIALGSELLKLSRINTFEASSINVSDETKLFATATGRIGIGTYDINVLQLARNHQLASQGLSDESLAALGTGTIIIQVGDGTEQTITVDSSNNSLVGVKNAINNAKLGATASIINDGSTSNPYRLIISSDKTGIDSKMSITSSLTGGTNLDFSGTSFDSPEIISFNSGSDSKVTLGATASYTGSENKIYSFTVKGTGAQTVGSGDIDIDWTDGVNSGTITVAAADTEVALTGTGADGLKLSFAAGDLNAGDTFQVTTFAPLLQEASDAKITIGSSGGGGTPITVTSAVNTFKDVLAGLELTILGTTDPDKSVTVNTSTDTTAIRNSINAFIRRYNEVNEFIDKQNSYNQETGESGVLFGDFTIQSVQNSLKKALGSSVAGIESQFNQLFSIGIRSLGGGRLSIAEPSRLNDALNNNLDDVIKLFTDSASSSSAFIRFVAASSKTKTGEKFDVDITQAASKGRFQGSGITDPATTPITLNSSNNRLKLKVDGVISDEIILTEKTYNTTTELINEITDKISSDAKIGKRGATVEWVSTGVGTGYIEFKSSTYGSISKLEVDTAIPSSASNILGLTGGTAHAGLDVEGTINGETAEGKGQILTGKEGNPNTDGLKILITLSGSQLVSGAEGIITVTRGVSARLNDLVESITQFSEGTFDRKIKSVEGQIKRLNERIEDIDDRLEIRRDVLLRQFYEMETALSELNAQGQFLAGQIALLNQNWAQISRNS